jgi:predicted CopG family antitoxin
MYKTNKEIELILSLYPIAKKKHLEIQEILKLNHSNEITKQIMIEDNFYIKLIEMVEDWLKYLTKEEIKFIDYRFFHDYSLQTIANKTNYSNHSSIIKKIDKLVKKIEENINL